MAAFQKTVAENFAVKSAEDTQKNREAVEEATNRLEERIDKFREEQGTQMASLKRAQEKFQEEVKALMAEKHTPHRSEDDEEFSESRANRRNRRSYDEGGGGNWKYRKLEMPLFEGKDPDGWILGGKKWHTLAM